MYLHEIAKEVDYKAETEENRDNLFMLRKSYYILLNKNQNNRGQTFSLSSLNNAVLLIHIYVPLKGRFFSSCFSMLSIKFSNKILKREGDDDDGTDRKMLGNKVNPGS